MPSPVFDTLSYAKKLENAGFTPQQAEIQANALRDIMDEKLATKRDLKELELRLKYDLTIRLGGITVACAAVLFAALSFVLK